MKRRIAVASLVLVILLLAIMPGAAIARQPEGDVFSASGTITDIEDTMVGVNAFPLGNSGRWRVQDRDIYGQLTAGDINGEFVLTYDGVFSIETQQGQLRGTMVAGDTTFWVTGSVQPLEMVPSGMGFDLPMLTITGNWQQVRSNWWSRWFKYGVQTGTFEAYVVFIPDEDKHVAKIIDSAFTMTGRKFSSQWWGPVG